jgi:hypothetical protein
MGRPFPVLAPITSTVLFCIPFKEIFHLVRYPNWQSAITGTGRDSFCTIFGTELCHFRYGHSLGPVPKLGSMRGSHFRYRALPVPVRSFTGPRTATVCVVPFLVRGSASSGTVIHWAPYQNWALCDGASGVSLSLLVTEEALSQKTKITNGKRSTGNGISHFR